MNLESELFDEAKKGIVSPEQLERALLIICGLKTEDDIGSYQQKLDKIQQEFNEFKYSGERDDLYNAMQDSILGDSVEPGAYNALLLFSYLWNTKPCRFGSNNKLTDVIDGQLSDNKNEKVGDCSGLTKLYSLLGLREGLDLSILYCPSQLMSRLNCGNRTIDIQNTVCGGFGQTDERRQLEFPVYSLVSIGYAERGTEKYNAGDFSGAIEDSDKAIELNPSLSYAYYLRAVSNYSLNNYEMALNDIDRAINISPEYPEFYEGRSHINYALGRFEDAGRDHDLAIHPFRTYA